MITEIYMFGIFSTFFCELPRSFSPCVPILVLGWQWVCEMNLDGISRKLIDSHPIIELQLQSGHFDDTVIRNIGIGHAMDVI